MVYDRSISDSAYMVYDRSISDSVFHLQILSLRVSSIIVSKSIVDGLIDKHREQVFPKMKAQSPAR